jgi:DNA polymerase-1
MTSSSGPLLAVDTPNLLYRAFFAIKASITGVDDMPVNALLGTANLVLRAVEEHRPRAVVLCFGAEDAVYRTSLYPPYHAARPPMPDDLRVQWNRAEELYGAFGWTVLTHPELEADDLLGTLARLEGEAGGEMLLYSGDRDMYQCVTERVRVLFPRGGRDGPEEVDLAGVQERYGIRPDQVPDFIALRGDPSDGLPGAKGIGEKTARDLLRAHGTLEGVLAAAAAVPRPASMSARQAGTLAESADELRMFRHIAQLQPVEGLARPQDRPTDWAGASAAAGAFGMGALAERLAKLGGGPTA